MECSLPDSSFPGIFQAGILEWVAISFSRDLPNPGMEPESSVSCTGWQVLYQLSHRGTPHCCHCPKAVEAGVACQEGESGGHRGGEGGTQRSSSRESCPAPQYLNGTVAPIHLVIHQLNAVLHALWGQQFGLAHDSCRQEKAGDRGCAEVLCEGVSVPNQIPSGPQLTVHGCWGGSAHAPVLDLVHGLCGPLPLLLPLGWHGGHRGWWSSALWG